MCGGIIINEAVNTVDRFTGCQCSEHHPGLSVHPLALHREGRTELPLDQLHSWTPPSILGLCMQKGVGSITVCVKGMK